MVFSCTLCSHSDEYCYSSRFCSKCQKIKHYLNLYEDRVLEVLDSVLSRDVDKQENKINNELKKEIEVKTNTLKKKKVKFLATTD